MIHTGQRVKKSTECGFVAARLLLAVSTGKRTLLEDCRGRTRSHKLVVPPESHSSADEEAEEQGAQTWAKRAAVPKPTRKRVATQEANWRRNWRQLTPVPLSVSHMPTPMTAPVMHWLEEVGSPYLRAHDIATSMLLFPPLQSDHLSELYICLTASFSVSLS